MENIFISGMRFELPHAKAPDWVKGKISIKIDDFLKFAENNKTESGWVNIDLKVSNGGKAYCELNTWKPNSDNSPKTAPNSQDNKDDERFNVEELPF